VYIISLKLFRATFGSGINFYAENAGTKNKPKSKARQISSFRIVSFFALLN